MLPKAMNWVPSIVDTFWVFWDIAGDKDYIFIPFNDEEMRLIFKDLTSIDELDEETILSVELSMLARSDTMFTTEALNVDEFDYTGENILNMDFHIDRTNLTEEQYDAAVMSQQIRQRNGWNAAMIYKLYLPAEHFMLMEGKLPSSFYRGSVASWDTEKYGSPKLWNALYPVEILEFSALIMAAVSKLRDGLTGDLV
jgi:hypothetical protein